MTGLGTFNHLLARTGGVLPSEFGWNIWVVPVLHSLAVCAGRLRAAPHTLQLQRNVLRASFM